jgi:serine/threonine-protein kinase
MSRAPAVVPGAVIARKYRVERQLGRGGMGVVLEATHTGLGQRVAIKMLHGIAPGQLREARARFQREARVAAQLTSDHIARVIDLGESEEGEPFLVMELLVGNDLDAELRARGAFPVQEAVDVILQACAGVAEAHAAGLVHRDLKPANLFVCRRRAGTGNAALVKVLDFGLSKVNDDSDVGLTQTEHAMGTPQYMSPEQTRSAKHVDARTDQHALALVLYELLTGRAAFEGETALGILVDIRIKPAPHPRALRPELAPALDAAIVRALAKDPDERYADLAGFARAVEPFGGPQAAGWAQAVEAAIATPSRLRYGDDASSEASEASEAQTQTSPSPSPSPRRPPSPPSVSDTAATQPMIAGAPRPPARRRGPMVVTLAALGALATVVTVGLALRTTRDRGGDGMSAPEAPATAAAAVPQEAVAAPTGLPAPSAQTREPDAAGATSAASSGSATAADPPRPSARASAAPRAPAGPAAASDDPKKVFNKR